MLVKLEKHIGKRYDGKVVELGQFQVFADGQLVGYLPYDKNIDLMLIIPRPTYDQEKEIVEKCAAITGREVKYTYRSPILYQMADSIDNSKGADRPPVAPKA